MSQDYHESVAIQNTMRLRERLKELPPFLRSFFRGIEDYTSSRTRIGYAYDLRLFFDFLVKETTRFGGMELDKLTVEDLGRITADEIEEFMDYLSFYVKTTETEAELEIQNQERGKSRKLFAVRAMFSFYFKKRLIPSNPSELVDPPKLHERAKVYLEVDEIAKLLDEVESGEHLTKQQKNFHAKTKTRDLAILTLLLGTGIRVSECVGLNIQHIDFEKSSFLVTRKGGDQAILYFGREVYEALSLYLDEREKIPAAEGHEDAFFLSLQNRRLTDRAIQNLVKKYAKLITHLKKITPHKLRSTFGTNLYRETGDIYLVADVLGHADVNTTRKHYADADKEKARRAVRDLTLRDD